VGKNSQRICATNFKNLPKENNRPIGEKMSKTVVRSNPAKVFALREEKSYIETCMVSFIVEFGKPSVI
jgi:hypothetical protein